MDKKNELSVTRAADLCGVGRTTIGYWIRSKKVRANRTGRNYKIPIEDLVCYLRATGQEIPPEFLDEEGKEPFFKSFLNCWQYWQGTEHGENCKDCAAYRNQLKTCFLTRYSSGPDVEKECYACRYYKEIYYPRVQFVNQINQPAVVYGDLYFYYGNQLWADLCGVKENDLIGLGIENVVHSESLGIMMSDTKKRTLGDSTVPKSYEIFLKNNDKLKIDISIYPLLDPENAFLIIGESGT